MIPQKSSHQTKIKDFHKNLGVLITHKAWALKKLKCLKLLCLLTSSNLRFVVKNNEYKSCNSFNVLR